ncbi:hypothetical protein WAI453_013067 [Rhynchosporium graminicola]
MALKKLVLLVPAIGLHNACPTITAVKTLNDTVARYKGRDKTHWKRPQLLRLRFWHFLKVLLVGAPSLKDWAKMEFMRGDINEFIDTLADYKSIIIIGLGTINMHTSRLT